MPRQFWIDLRQALLMIVAAIERELDITPRTAELRKEQKQERKRGGAV